MYIDYRFDYAFLTITVTSKDGRDAIKIPREEFIDWLNLKDVLDAYNLAKETAEKL